VPKWHRHNSEIAASLCFSRQILCPCQVYDRSCKIHRGYEENDSRHPTDWKTMIGPVSVKRTATLSRDTFNPRSTRVQSYPRRKRPTAPPMDKGYWVLPTVITGVTQKMRSPEKRFRPGGGFMEPFNFDEEVIEKANDNTFGLQHMSGRPTRPGDEIYQ